MRVFKGCELQGFSPTSGCSLSDFTRVYKGLGFLQLWNVRASVISNMAPSISARVEPQATPIPHPSSKATQKPLKAPPHAKTSLSVISNLDRRRRPGDLHERKKLQESDGGPTGGSGVRCPDGTTHACVHPPVVPRSNGKLENPKT